MNFKDTYHKYLSSDQVSELEKRNLQKIVSTKTDFENWEDSFWISKILDEFLNSESNYDDLLAKLIRSTFINGLNYDTDKQKFLECLLIYIRIQFKYGKYKEVENYLLLIRELEFSGSVIPSWVYQYSAVTYYKLEIKSIISNPKEFFSCIEHIDDQNDNENRKRIFVLRDFLNELQSKKIENQYNTEDFSSFFKRLGEFILPYLDEVFNEWIELAETIIKKTGKLESVYSLRDLSYFYEKVKSQNNLIHQQEVEIIKLKSELQNTDDKIKGLENTIRSIDNGSSSLIETASTNQIEKTDQIKLFRQTNKKRRIMVFGATRISASDIYGIAKTFGLLKDEIVLFDDYEKNKNFDFSKIQYNSPYQGILFGPTAHSMKGKGDYSSIIEMLKNEEGYPPFEIIRNEANELKVTKTSFKKALERLVVRLEAQS